MRGDKVFFKPESVENMRCVYEILQHAAANYPDVTAYRQIESRKDESEITFSKLKEQVDCLHLALLKRGLLEKHIAVIGETSIEWITAFLAIVSGVGVCVPIDKELMPDTIIKQLTQSDTDYIFASSRSIKKLEKILPDCPGIKGIVIMRGGIPENFEACNDIYSLEELITEGRDLLLSGDSVSAETINPDKTCEIIFTSGTTGANKGVMLTNRNIMGTLRGCARLLHYPKTSFSVLPINHSYELHAHLMSSMYCGTTVCLNDDMKHFLKNLQRFSPEMSCMVPMMLDLIVKKLEKEIKDSGKETQFKRMVTISNLERKLGIDKRRQYFKDILKQLGGNLHMIICGGAALNQTTIDFLNSIGIDVFNGYGITECSPVAAVNSSRWSKRNSVGHILPTTDIRIMDSDSHGNGEIQLRGDNIMKGYYKAPEDTKAVFTEDGWFRTGDIGHKDKDGFVYITGRLKNLIILPNGKNICPEEIESILKKKIPYIKESIVVPNSDNTGLYAIICPETEFCKNHELDSPEKIKAFMLEDMRCYNRNVPGFKRISDFEITEKEFEKSTTHKIQRFKIKTKLEEEKKENV